MLTEAAGEFSRGWSLMSSVGGISSEVLLLNILAVGLAVVLFRDVRRLPLIVLACLAAVFVSTPVAVVMKGIKSAVYVVDLMPLVLVPFLLSAARRRVFGEGVVLAVAMLMPMSMSAPLTGLAVTGFAADTNGVALDAVAGLQIYTQALENVQGDISNHVVFVAATAAQAGITNDTVMGWAQGYYANEADARDDANAVVADDGDYGMHGK